MPKETKIGLFSYFSDIGQCSWNVADEEDGHNGHQNGGSNEGSSLLISLGGRGCSGWDVSSPTLSFDHGHDDVDVQVSHGAHRNKEVDDKLSHKKVVKLVIRVLSVIKHIITQLSHSDLLIIFLIITYLSIKAIKCVFHRHL